MSDGYQLSNPFQACNDVLFKPNKVFAELADKHNWAWVPFFIVLVMMVLPGYLYFNFVDFAWYTDLMVEAQMGDKSPAEQDAFRNNLTQTSVLAFVLIGGILGPILVNAVLAVYLNLTTRMDPDNVNGFTDWYGFTWWISLPVVFAGLASLLVIAFASDHQLSPSSAGATSLAFILGLDLTSDWIGLAQSIRIDSFWTMYLVAAGIVQWTKVSAQKAYVIAVAPYAVIWGVWALFAAF